MTNCKVGDLAIVVRSTLGNLGKIVRVLESYRNGFRGPDGRGYASSPARTTWIVECDGGLATKLTNNGIVSLKVRAFSDAGLRPIRDQEGDDETILWEGLPQGQAVTK